MSHVSGTQMLSLQATIIDDYMMTKRRLRLIKIYDDEDNLESNVHDSMLDNGELQEPRPKS